MLTAFISGGRSLVRQCSSLAATVSYRATIRPAAGLQSLTKTPTLPISQDGRCQLRASNQWRLASGIANPDLRRTPLHDLHVRHGGKMVPFAGFNMPVQYADQGIGDSHKFTRSHASLFDVSHMVQHTLSGPGAQGLLTRITPAALGSIPPHHSTLSCLLLPGTGGIVDDCIITRLGPQDFYFVTNAACREKDLAFLTESIEDYRASDPMQAKEIKHEVLETQALIALQGPLAPQLLEPFLLSMPASDLQKLYFGQSTTVTLNLSPDTKTPKPSSPILISRGGYTGEDGFEISVPAAEAPELVNALFTKSGSEKLRLAGLGARDTLRLEAGMCLYGHDISEDTTPVEAGLGWIIPKDRRVEGGFNGAEVILRQLVPKLKGGGGVHRRRVGLMLREGAPPAREGAKIVNGRGEGLGSVTSGAPSPTLGRCVAMGYLRDGWHKVGTEVEVVVRGKRHAAEVVKMPFVASKYWKGGVSPG